MDIDKLQRSIKACAHHPEHDCDNCEYSDDKLWCYNDELLSDFDKAIELLKTQQKQIESMNFIYGFVYGGQVREIKELVRCKNCKWHTMRGEMLLCTAQDKPHTYDWYCADGVRMEEEGEPDAAQNQDS